MQTHSSTRAGVRWLTRAAAIAACCVAPLATAAPPSFITFDTGQVRPLALSANGSRLYAVNTPNDTLVIYDVTDEGHGGLIKRAEVSVGMEPVAVAARNDDEVWVVNNLSDSVSVVSLRGTPHVTQTLLVGDEPRDIVFAGEPARAFITTAHRGQHRTDPSIATVPGAGDPQLETPSIGRADVWVFDPVNLGDSLGGTPVKIMTFFSDTPRALAVSPDHRTVYVAAFNSGNQTATVPAYLPCLGFQLDTPCVSFGVPVPGGSLGPATNVEGKPSSANGFIAKFNNESGHWEDTLGRNWDSVFRFRLPDLDVFSVDTRTLEQKAAFAHVGTTLFNMVTNPRSGTLYVSNTESMNQGRFEGPGIFGGSTVQGHVAESRISIISGSTVSPRHLNKHINYSILANDPSFDPTVKNHSLATPLDMAVSRNGTTLYVAAFGSGKIGVFDTAQLEADTFDPRVASAGYIPVSGGGPSGLALDENRNRLYVLTRFDNSVKVIDLATKREAAAATMFNPEPRSVVAGRPLLYDAFTTSANGEASCSSCHIFGDKDDLAWDIGNPDALVTHNPIPLTGLFLIAGETPINGTGNPADFHPMKGVMGTQTLRGMRNHGAMHWRGDRSVGVFGTDPFDSELSFNNFIGAFQDLLGRATPLSAAQMRTLTAFQLQVQLPPNPVRNLDNSLTPAQQLGRDFFVGPRPSISFAPVPGTGADNGVSCEACHRLDPAQGFFGTDGHASSVFEPLMFKIPHLRNLYTKVGMFGLVSVPLFLTPDTGQLGDQVRGFGFVHDATVDTLFHFNTSLPFAPTPNAGLPMQNTDDVRHGLEQYMLAFETDLPPIVGQQITLTATNAAVVGPRIDLLQARAAAPFTSKLLGGTVTECDLVAKVSIRGQPKGFLYNAGADAFVGENEDRRRVAIPSLSFRNLAGVPGQEITFTCVPPGSGPRMTAAL